MANELLDSMELIGNYVDGLQAGITKFIDVIPILMQQHIGQLAKSKLNTSFDNYMSAVTSKVEGNVLVVELDKDNWLANAVESGVGGFDIKAGLLNSPKAKIGKNGKKFIIVPIGKQKNGKGGGTEKSQDYQRRINEVLLKPKVGLSKLKTRLDGGVYETQQIINDDPLLQGFYRSRVFDSAQDFYAGKKKPAWGHVLFRIVSENSDKDSWQHPGIQKADIFGQTSQWFDNTASALLDSIIEAELKSRKVI